MRSFYSQRLSRQKIFAVIILELGSIKKSKVATPEGFQIFLDITVFQKSLYFSNIATMLRRVFFRVARLRLVIKTSLKELKHSANKSVLNDLFERLMVIFFKPGNMIERLTTWSVQVIFVSKNCPTSAHKPSLHGQFFARSFFLRDQDI